MVQKGEQDFHKEELFYFLLSQLMEENTPAMPQAGAAAQVQAVCDYLDQNYSETITLQQLSELTGWSKYHLLRTFTRQKGITPYSYLETVRVAQAKRLLVQGVCPMSMGNSPRYATPALSQRCGAGRQGRPGHPPSFRYSRNRRRHNG